jgi:hypothetical protein
VFFRLSKHEKPMSFLSLDSLNKHWKTHMGPNHSFLGFIKHTPRDSSEGWAYINKHMLSSWSLSKNKEVLARNGGRKLGKKRRTVFVLVAVIVSLEHDTPLHHCIRVGKSICLSFDHPQIHMLGPPWVNAAQTIVVSFICSREVQHKQAFYRVGHLQL